MSTVAFFQGKDFYYLTRSNIHVDYEELRDYLKENYHVEAINYYALLPSNEDGNKSLTSLLDFLRHQPLYHVVSTKARSQRDTVSLTGKIAMDAMDAYENGMKRAVIGTTSVEMVPIVKGLQKRGVEIVLASSQSKIDNRLSPLADDFIELEQFDRQQLLVDQ